MRRFGHLGLVILLAAVGASETAFAKGRGTGTPPAATDPARQATRAAVRDAKADPNNVGIARDGSRVGPNQINPTYGPSSPIPGSGSERNHQMREVWARNSDPIVAERPDAPGKFYDARPNGQRGTMNAQDAADAMARQELYNQSDSVTLYDWQSEEASAAVWDGSAGEMVDGTGAKIEACALCASAEAQGSVGLTGNGVQANFEAEAGAYLGRVQGEAGYQYQGDVVSAGVNAQGEVMVGAKVYANGTAEISTERLLANGKIGGVAGFQAEGEVTGSVGLTQVGQVDATVNGKFIAGVAAEAEGYFEIDWTNFEIRAGGRVAAALGIGGGVGFDTTISVKPAVEAIGRGLSRAGSAIADVGRDVGRSLCFWCDDDPPAASPMPPAAQSGSQVALNSNTTGAGGASGNGSGSGYTAPGAEAAGLARD